MSYLEEINRKIVDYDNDILAAKVVRIMFMYQSNLFKSNLL